MNDTELSALKLLSETLQPAPVIVLIRSDETAFFPLLKHSIYSVLMAINRYYAESTESIIRMNGDADVIGRSWIFPVDMVVIEDPVSKPDLELRIDTWASRLVTHGIFVFLHYEEEGYEYVKEVVDEKMKNHEQVARAGTLSAYQLDDPVVDVAWAMAEKSYNKHGVVQ